jgi:hypothetical protein
VRRAYPSRSTASMSAADLTCVAECMQEVSCCSLYQPASAGTTASVPVPTGMLQLLPLSGSDDHEVLLAVGEWTSTELPSPLYLDKSEPLDHCVAL